MPSEDIEYFKDGSEHEHTDMSIHLLSYFILRKENYI